MGLETALSTTTTADTLPLRGRVGRASGSSRRRRAGAHTIWPTLSAFDAPHLRELLSVDINDVLYDRTAALLAKFPGGLTKREARRAAKAGIVERGVVIGGVRIAVTTTATMFGGKRAWFVCPTCGARRGKLSAVGQRRVRCRGCLRLRGRGAREKARSR